jgi:hypothetical protein
LGKTIALRFEIVRFLKKPALYALKTLNFKLTLPSLANFSGCRPTVLCSSKNNINFTLKQVLLLTNKADDSFSLDLNLIVIPRKLHFC